MKYNVLGRTGLEVSQVGFGVLTVGKTQLNLPIEKGAELIRYAMDRGMNFLDTAQFYETYPYIKKALKGGRYNPIIASKCLYSSYNAMSEAIEEARQALDRDVIDIFLLHEVRHGSDFQDRAGAFECLQDAKAKGLVKAIGVSTHHVDVAEKMASVAGCDILFPLINYQSLGIRKGSGPGNKEEMEKAIALCKAKGMGIFAMKAFGGGNLTVHYQQALNYVFSLTDLDSVMIGFGKQKEIDEICEYLDGKMLPSYQPDTGDKRVIIDQGDCEGCGACIKRCPNKAIFFNKAGLAEVDREKCVTCGYCAPVCPVRAILLVDLR